MTVFCDLLLGLTTDSPTRLLRLLYLLSTFWDEGYCVKSKRCHGDMLRCHLHMHWPRRRKTTTASSRFPRFCLNILRDRPLLPCQASLRAVLWCTDVLALLLGVVEPSRPVWLLMCACALHSYTLPPTGIFSACPPVTANQTEIGWWHGQPLNKETQIF